MPAPTISSFTPRAACATICIIKGTNLDTFTNVHFTGQVGGPAGFAVSSSEIHIYVPNSAVTGPITVTTPSGSVTTVTDFTPIPVLELLASNSNLSEGYTPTDWNGGTFGGSYPALCKLSDSVALLAYEGADVFSYRDAGQGLIRAIAVGAASITPGPSVRFDSLPPSPPNYVGAIGQVVSGMVWLLPFDGIHAVLAYSIYSLTGLRINARLVTVLSPSAAPILGPEHTLYDLSLGGFPPGFGLGVGLSGSQAAIVFPNVSTSSGNPDSIVLITLGLGDISFSLSTLPRGTIAAGANSISLTRLSNTTALFFSIAGFVQDAGVHRMRIIDFSGTPSVTVSTDSSASRPIIRNAGGNKESSGWVQPVRAALVVGTTLADTKFWYPAGPAWEDGSAWGPPNCILATVTSPPPHPYPLGGYYASLQVTATGGAMKVYGYFDLPPIAGGTILSPGKRVWAIHGGQAVTVDIWGLGLTNGGRHYAANMQILYWDAAGNYLGINASGFRFLPPGIWTQLGGEMPASPAGAAFMSLTVQGIRDDIGFGSGVTDGDSYLISDITLTETTSDAYAMLLYQEELFTNFQGWQETALGVLHFVDSIDIAATYDSHGSGYMNHWAPLANNPARIAAFAYPGEPVSGHGGIDAYRNDWADDPTLSSRTITRFPRLPLPLVEGYYDGGGGTRLLGNALSFKDRVLYVAADPSTGAVAGVLVGMHDEAAPISGTGGLAWGAALQ